MTSRLQGHLRSLGGGVRGHRVVPVGCSGGRGVLLWGARGLLWLPELCPGSSHRQSEGPRGRRHPQEAQPGGPDRLLLLWSLMVWPPTGQLRVGHPVHLLQRVCCRLRHLLWRTSSCHPSLVPRRHLRLLGRSPACQQHWLLGGPASQLLQLGGRSVCLPRLENLVLQTKSIPSRSWGHRQGGHYFQVVRRLVTWAGRSVQEGALHGAKTMLFLCEDSGTSPFFWRGGSVM